MATTHCPDCHGVVIDKSKACIHCGSTAHRSWWHRPAFANRIVIGVLALWVVAALFSVLADKDDDRKVVSEARTIGKGDIEPPKKEKESKSFPDYAGTASAYCKAAIESKLKAPSTADYESWSVPTRIDRSRQIYEWRSYVDAQNGFGAQVRTRFYCKAQCTDVSDCDLMDLQIK